jgi:hypothetical protein
MTKASPVQRYLATIGQRGGRVRSDAKAAAARENGAKGGRPLRTVWRRVKRGIVETTIDGVTYRATHYQSAGPLTRQYWTIRDSADDDVSGGWTESSLANVKAAVAAVARQRRRAARGE